MQILGCSFAVLIMLTPLSAASAAATLDLLPQDDDKAMEVIKESIKNRIKRGTLFVLGIEERLENSHDELNLLRKNIDALEDKIAESKVRVLNLESQIQNLDHLISNNKLKIKAAELLIAEAKNKILVLKEDIKQKETELKENLESLGGLFNAYYMQTNMFFDTQDETPRLLALLAAENTTGEIMKENSYLLFLQEASNELARQIILDGDALDKKRGELEQKQETLEQLQMLLSRTENILKAAYESKQRLWDETKGRQIIYETLLELSKKEAEQVDAEIKRLKENYDFFQTKLEALKKLPAAADIRPEDLDLDEGETILKGKQELAWPVSPSLGISAYYHDAAYQKAMGIRHNAVDIRVIQGSKVRAAADGVVSKVADNGFGYSYIILAHPNKTLTLYGHISKMLVNEGEIVRQGQTIGLSGGIPGTIGAGWLTTGAHLHFEVFKDFQHVDPLNHLPLEFVPVASLPDKYLKRITGEAAENKVKRPADLTLP